MSDLQIFDPILDRETDCESDAIARAGRAFRNGALTATCFITGALCMVAVYVASILIGGKIVGVVSHILP